jgi:hypothetical protein
MKRKCIVSIAQEAEMTKKDLPLVRDKADMLISVMLKQYRMLDDDMYESEEQKVAEKMFTFIELIFKLHRFI